MARNKSTPYFGEGCKTYEGPLTITIPMLVSDDKRLMPVHKIMERRLEALEDKSRLHQRLRNSWWNFGFHTSSAYACFPDNMVKVVPDASELMMGITPESELDCHGGLLITQAKLDGLEGEVYKRDGSRESIDFQMHGIQSREARETASNQVLLDICNGRRDIVEAYVNVLFEKGGTPEEKREGYSWGHLIVGDTHGVDEPVLYPLSFYFQGMWSTSPIGQSIRPNEFNDEKSRLIGVDK